MKKPILRPPFVRAVACGALVLALVVPAAQFLRAAEKPSASKALSPLAGELTGTWVLLGRPPEKLETPPATGGRLKLRTARHWAFVSVDPRSGLVVSTHGGTWRVVGDVYEETVEYGGEYQAEWIGKTFHWTIKLEGDRMTKTGTDNPWHEVWQRVK